MYYKNRLQIIYIKEFGVANDAFLLNTQTPVVILDILDSLSLNIYFKMSKKLPFLLYILFVISLSSAEVNKQCNQRKFRINSSGSLSGAYNAYKVLFSGNGGSFHAALRECTEFCWGDRRCIGMEVCRIREDLYVGLVVSG